MSKKNSLIAMITQHSWMFLSSFEKLRSKMLPLDTINMAHLGARAFEEIAGEVVQTTTWVQRKSNIRHYRAAYTRLVDFNSQQEKEKEFLNRDNIHVSFKESFSKIPGSPIAYWMSDALLHNFSVGEVLKEKGDTRQGMATSDNNRFLRLWHEVKFTRIGIGCDSAEEAVNVAKKWYPYNKGGEFRKWYGNVNYIINYEKDGFEVKQYATSLYRTPTRTIKSMSEYFKASLSWSKISSGSIAFRYYPEGFVFDVAGCCIFYEDTKIMFYDFGFINSKIARSILSAISPTLNYEAGHIASLPVIRKDDILDSVGDITGRNVKISKTDWDSFETSWDFKHHPLINEKTIQSSFGNWSNECKHRFDQLKNNEEELNRIFIDIYGLQDELTPEVDDKDITIRKAVLGRDIKSFISYAVGCMFGRYSMDVDGLAYASGDWDDSKYNTFIPDKDNCILITDEEYFDDDIVGRFVEFVQCVYGAETLEENIDFIAKALGSKGDTSREIIRNYFIKDFYKDHVKTYQKRPIYWLYDSGKQDGFKALVYMHRYSADTTGIVRVDYLHKMQKIYMSEIDRMIDTTENSNNAREISQAEKRKEKLVKQLKETKEYDEKIAHLAISRIAIDLDDGVKVNYEKVQTGQDGKKFGILGKI